ncbi:hypothetical protein MKX01_005093 [Papaver californicum]|nr:hypothetical protein MKX01_005093 [Papaver californicum]
MSKSGPWWFLHKDSQKTNDPEIYLRYTNLKIGEPSFSVDTSEYSLTPHSCRLTDMTYAAPITVVVECSQGVNGRREISKPKEVVIGLMPVMLRSCRCVFNGKDEEELAKFGECPLDPGGYFVVEGTEKVILIQEQLSNNRIIIDTDRKGHLVASVTKYDQEVVQMVGRDPRYASMLLPSIQECATENVDNQKQALEFLDNKVKRYAFSTASQEGRALNILRDVFLDNVPVRELNFRPKCIYAARLELSGQLISLLFEDLFKTMNDEARKRMNLDLKKHAPRSIDSYITGNSITHGLERAISTGNWNLRRFRMHRTGMAQVLARLFFIAAVGHMRRVRPQFEKSRKVSGPRALQPSQWGMLCPCDTPEGETPLISLCHSLGVESLELLSAEDIHLPNSFLVIFNGIIFGKHRLPQRFATSMRKLRRAGKIGEFINGGRVCRPLVIADKEKSRVKKRHMQELRDGVRTFSDFLHDGLIEYLDVNEQNNALIALYDGEPNKEITHIEIEPLTILGVCAGLIPYPHHNQSPRNTYQCAMGKQAMGNIAYNQLSRMDSLLYLLVYPQRPLLTTQTIELVGYDKLGAGQNATDEYIRRRWDCSSWKTIRPHDIYVNKEVPIITKDAVNPLNVGFKPAYERYKCTKGETEVIYRVALFSDINNNLCIKFQIRHTRRPEVGDKFSSRHGQKGVCGTIVQQEDFPFSEQGICPDLIMNPHGFPSRMTIGKMIELLGGKAGVSCGRFHYGGASGEPSGTADRFSVLRYHWVSSTSIYIFTGPIYYQKLKHMVLDKMHAHASEGRSRNGGLRLGEMERDCCLITYGASMLIYERLMISSDPYEVQVCRACGLLGYYSHKLKIGVCSSCRNGENISKMKLP